MHHVCGSVKRDLFTRQKRPTYTAKETYLRGKRDPCMRKCQKRPTYVDKETHVYGKRDLLSLGSLEEAAPSAFQECIWCPGVMYAQVAKETYYCRKRDLLLPQKETYGYLRKRVMHLVSLSYVCMRKWQKRPTDTAKETY